MLKQLVSMLSRIVDHFGYKVSRNKTVFDSDDPYVIISRIIDPKTVKVIIDAGASIGNTTVKLSSLFPKSTVYAFEPYPLFIKQLDERAKKNNNIKVVPFALGHENGRRIFNVNQSEGTNSLLKSGDRAREIYGSLIDQKELIEINAKTLYSWSCENNISKIDILKLDLQGGELDALKGADKLLKFGKVKSILCEVMFTTCYEEQANWTELVSYIENSGFQLFNLYQENHYNGKILQADLLFIHENSMDISMKMAKKHFLPFSNILSNA